MQKCPGSRDMCAQIAYIGYTLGGWHRTASSQYHPSLIFFLDTYLDLALATRIAAVAASAWENHEVPGVFKYM